MRKSDEELQKHTLNLFKGDYARIQIYFPDLDAASVIRKIVRTFINSVEAGDAAMPKTEIDL